MNTRSRAARLALVVGIGLLGACKLEPIEDLEISEPAPPTLPDRVVPLSTERPVGDRQAERWDASLNRYLGFIHGEPLQGRRPGTEGATLTVGFVISVLEGAGLSPNGPDLGWTQPVGIRIVEMHDPVLTVRHAAKEGERKAPAPLRFTEDLWLEHRGAAGEFSHALRIDGPEPAVDPEATPEDGQAPLERLQAPPLPVPEDGRSVRDLYREVFDTAWRDGVGVAVMPIPGPDQVEARAIAESWRRPDVQSLLPGRDPPAALDLEGFVPPEVHAALLEARDRPGSSIDVDFRVDERWFEDSNVIGRIAGGRRPEQAVVVVANWDAGEDEAGAPSNGSGLAVLLALAEASGRWRSVGRRPERSLIFVATAAGSLSHRGATRFIESSGIRPSNIIAVINLEQLGGAGSDLLVLDGHHSSLSDDVTTLDATARIVPDDAARHGHRPFVDRRIPAVTLSRPAEPGEDGEPPELSIAALRNDAELAFRLLWELSDRREIPRLAEADPPSPDDGTRAAAGTTP
ncbi:MAG: M28 family peptidase [Myxococcota bacterium]